MDRMTIEEQVALLMQGTDYGDDSISQAMARELGERLAASGREGRPLRVYCGYDPRRPDLHLGHTITLRKLRQFQDLGHEVTLLVGTGTSLVGDPSDKDELRAILTLEQAEENGRTYAEQSFSILDREKTRVRFNHEWLLKLGLREMIRIGSAFTLQQIVQRDNFRLRWDRGDPVYLHETFYALMQGYDAVALKADVQVGGSEQLFNIITAGRKVQEAFGLPPQIGILVGILPGTDGVIRMSKSLGNHIPIFTTPEDMYGKIMSLPDSAMPQYFKLLLQYSPAQLARLEEDLRAGKRHPRDTKMELARTIVGIFHGEGAAARAEAEFRRIFQEGQAPQEMATFPLAPGAVLIDILVSAGMAGSKSQAKRLVAQGGVRIDGEPVGDPMLVVALGAPAVLQVGKRGFLRLIPEGSGTNP
jgi:tyrosyl-tRNA synthetase